MSSSYRNSHLGKGENYHSSFYSQPRRSVIWAVEKQVIIGLIDKYFGDRSISHLDFACGTGRITSLIRSRATNSKGVDVSESMLSVAKEENPGVEFLAGDITLDDSLLAGEKFNLITAFRFFPNAEPELRALSLLKLRTLLSEDGILLLNNHRNRDCTRNRLVHAVTLGARGVSGWSERGVADFVQAGGLEVLEDVHIGLLPEWESFCWIRPRRFAQYLEQRLVGKQGVLRGEDVLYVCRKSGGT